ncbi:MAG: DotU family type IV/VI secretion system protein [Holosporales bacterium]|jgi:type VI secretion system protein ImpK|nr:DotU family type IV/VI secretion system protein [Holosporales bacterium]
MLEAEGNAFLVHLFDTFYEDVIACRKMAEEEMPPTQEESLGKASTLWDRLNGFLKKHTVLCLEQGGDFVDAYLKEAVYIMVALADEVFLNITWPGRLYWEKNLLETTFFGTHIAGEEIFQRIDQFLLNRENVLTDIAILYLKLLALGFKGQYRTQEDQGEIAAYKQRLYRFIVHGDPSIDFFDAKIFRQSYQPTLISIPKRELPDPSWWHYAFYGFLLCFILGTSLLWRAETASIAQLAHTIADMATEEGRL